jgi:hypothetical protein
MRAFVIAAVDDEPGRAGPAHFPRAIFYSRMQAQAIEAWPIKARRSRYRQAVTDCALKPGIVSIAGASGRGEVKVSSLRVRKRTGLT